MLTRRAILVAAGALSYSHFAVAQSGVSYVGAPGGFWHVATNWQPQVIPDNNLGAMPPVAYTVSIDRPVLINGELFDIAGMTNSGEVSTFTSWDFRGGEPSGSAFLLNTGTFSIVPVASASAYVSVANQNILNISGGGIWRLGGAGVARVLGSGTLINQDNAILGEGSFGEGVLNIVNNGVIAATDAAGAAGTLSLFGGPGGVTNSNTLQARNLGNLVVRGVVNNAGGTIIAENGGAVHMFSAPLIIGGTISTGATGSIHITNQTATWQGPIANMGHTVVNAALVLNGSVNNGGSFSVNDQIRIGGDVTLSGSGTIFLNGASVNRIGTAASLNTSNFISGRGVVGVSTMTINNSGTIRANGGSLIVDPGFQFTNTGTLLAEGGTLSLGGGTFLNAGGTIRAAQDSAVNLGFSRISGGTLASSGNGTFTIPTGATARLDGVTLNNAVIFANAGGGFAVRNRIGGVGTIELRTGMSIYGSATVDLHTNLRTGSAIGRGTGDFIIEPESDPVFFNDGTIAGAAAIGQNQLQIVNNGVIRGNGGTFAMSDPITLDPSAKGLLNAGIIEAVDLGVVVFTGAGSGGFTQTAMAVIRATDPGSNVQMITNTLLSGGNIGAGGGSVSLSGATTFESLVSDANVVQVGVSQLLINQNVVNTGTFTTPGAASILIAGSSTLNSASGHHINQGSININGGGFADFNFVDNVSTISVGQIIVSSSGQMMAHSIDQGALTIQNNAFATLKSSFAPSVDGSIVNNLSIGTIGAALDATNRGMAVTAGSINTIRDQIISGYAGGAWTGLGIRSSSAAANPGFGVGYAVANQIGSPPTFLGRSITPTSALFRYTLLGDANLNGTVNISDFSLLAANFNTAGPWVEGDFNYDQFVNISDFALLASNFNRSLPAHLPRESIPEPASLFFVASAVAVLQRQRARFTRSAPPRALVGVSDTTSSAA